MREFYSEDKLVYKEESIKKIAAAEKKDFREILAGTGVFLG